MSGTESNIIEMQRDIWKILVLRASWAIILLQSVIVPYFFYKSLSSREIFLVQSVFSLSLLACELPTGMLADILGKRYAIILACIFRGIGGTLVVIGDGFWGMATAYVVLAVANSLISGADVSLIVEKARAVTEENRALSFYLGRQKMFTLATSALSAVVGSYIAGYSFSALAIANMLVAWVALPVAISISNGGDTIRSGTSVFGKARSLVIDSSSALIKDPVSGMLCLCIASLISFNMVSLYSLQLQWVAFNFSAQLMGFLFAGRTLSAAFSSGMSSYLIKRVDGRLILSVTCILLFLSMWIAMLDSFFFAIIASIFVGTADGTASVLMISTLNERSEDGARATVNSIYSFLSRLLALLLSLCLSFSILYLGPSAPLRILSLWPFVIIVFFLIGNSLKEARKAKPSPSSIDDDNQSSRI